MNSGQAHMNNFRIFKNLLMIGITMLLLLLWVLLLFWEPSYAGGFSGTGEATIPPSNVAVFDQDKSSSFLLKPVPMFLIGRKSAGR